MVAIHEHMEVRAIGTVLRSLRAGPTGSILHPASAAPWPEADDWFAGWDVRLLSADGTRTDPASPGGSPCVLWGAINAEELDHLLAGVIDDSPLIVVANTGFPFGERGARRYLDGSDDPESKPVSSMGLNPFSGELLAQGIYSNLDWDDPAPGGLRSGLAQAQQRYAVSPAPDGARADQTVDAGGSDRWLWDLSDTSGVAVIVSGAWLHDVGLYYTAFSDLAEVINRSMLAELAPMTRRLALRNNSLEERTERLGGLVDRMQNLRDRTRRTEHLLAERDMWAARQPVPARPKGAGPALSVIHISYDMAREAPRSINTTLAPYQQGLADGDIEVVAVDNGSPEPLILGPEHSAAVNVRRHRQDPATTNLAAAINRGVEIAAADRVAIMVDGAHLLSPGVLSWTLRAFDLFDDPVVAAPRYFLGPAQQVDAHHHGYDAAAEDQLLDSVGWPDDGYSLFEASVLIGDSNPSWSSPLFETNFLAMTKKAFDEIGGADERFADPAGGFMNMDLFSRSVERMHGEYVLLAGEGTFHQLHGGTTTNTSRQNRAAKVEKYRKEFARLQGNPYIPTPRRPVVLGHLHAAAMAPTSFSRAFQHEADVARAALLAAHLDRVSGSDGPPQ